MIAELFFRVICDKRLRGFLADRARFARPLMYCDDYRAWLINVALLGGLVFKLSMRI